MKKLAAIFIIALLIRLAFIGVWYQMGQGDRLAPDGYGYRTLAQGLNQGKGFQIEGQATARRPPLYPLFAALLLRCSSFPLGIQIVQALLGALSCMILFLLGKEMFDEGTGFLAAAMLGIDYISVRQIVSVMPETLFVFILLGSFYFLIRFTQEKKTVWIILAGILAGFSLLTKETLLFYYPFVTLWFLLHSEPWRIRFFRAGVFSVSLLLVIGPWVVRNSLLRGHPVLLTEGSGRTLYLANNPQATGGSTGGDWALGVDTGMPKAVPSWLLNSSTPELEDRYFFKEAVKFIRDHPGRFAELTGRRVMNMWRPYQTDSPPPAQWATALSYLSAVTLGIWGIFWSRKQWREFFPIFILFSYVFLLHAVLIAHIRYRYPVMPFFMVFASFALLQIRRRWTIPHAHLIGQ